MGTIKFKQNNEVTEKYKNRDNEVQSREEHFAVDEVILSKGEKAKPTILYEDKNRREANVKHFKMSDGSYQAQIYNQPVHYYRETERRFVTIDSTLCECPACQDKEDDFDGYENKRGNVRVKFGKHSKNGKIFALKKGEYGVECSLIGDESKDRIAE